MAAYEAAGETDEWYTPRYIFDALGVSFNLDVACPPEGPLHVPAERYFSEGALERDWFGMVWMNPPFGHQSTKRLWLQKFFDHGCGIALLPDRTSAPWWQEFAPMADAILFVAPKVKFVIPEREIEKVRDMIRAHVPVKDIARATRFTEASVTRIINGKNPASSPGTGTTLFAAGQPATDALIRASDLGHAFLPCRRAAA